jgi:hypothetical protein
MARRQRKPLRFSMFMFQDIITCVTGIMILVTLILGLEFITRVDASPSNQIHEQDIKTVQTISELKHEIESAEKRINSARVSTEGLPSLDANELKSRADDLAADSDAIEREIAATEVQVRDNERKLEDAKAASAEEAKAIREEKETIEKQIATADEELKRIEDGKRILYRIGVHGKPTWLIEITSKGYRVAQIGVNAAPKTMTIAMINDWAKSLDKSSAAFLLVVKPGGKGAYLRIRSLLADDQLGKFGFDVGVHVVAADQDVLDPERGAGSL